MQDTDPEFDTHVALLAEASRIDPIFANKVLEAETDEEIDALVVQAKQIVDDEASQAWV